LFPGGGDGLQKKKQLKSSRYSLLAIVKKIIKMSKGKLASIKLTCFRKDVYEPSDVRLV
jgi:hypothetical protein